jgi:hypothetical protein
LIVSTKSIRAAFAHCAFTGISGRHLGLLITELEPRYRMAREDRLHRDRGIPRLRRPGAGAPPRLSFTDRLVATLVHLRLGIPHAALAVVFYEHDGPADERLILIADRYAPTERQSVHAIIAGQYLARPSDPGRRSKQAGAMDRFAVGRDTFVAGYGIARAATAGTEAVDGSPWRAAWGQMSVTHRSREHLAGVR